MRRFQLIALTLVCLLALAACGGTRDAVPPPQGAAGEEDGGGVTVYDCGGLQVALPSEYVDRLLVKTDFPGAEEHETRLISVYEKASSEASLADYGYEDGFLFGFLSMDQAAFEQTIGADVPGVEIFATGGERYYAYTFPTDVQFYRSGLSGSELLDHPDWAVWEELNEIGPQVQEDFLTRNGLQTFSIQDFLDHLSDGVDYAYVRYYPYAAVERDDSLYTQLFLRQPARQGEGGIWAVEQWMDAYGGQSLYFPDTGKPAAEYYAELQEACDAGEHPELLTPVGAAEFFVRELYGQETDVFSFEEVREPDRDYPERNQELQEMVYDLMFDEAVEDRDLLELVSEVKAENWDVLDRDLSGSEWYQPLMDALRNAAVGGDQQERDRAVMAFYLTGRGARRDFSPPLDEILQTQADADFDAFLTALETFSEEEREILQLNLSALR